jgi:hypothetical protein
VRTYVALASCLVIAAACRGKPKHQEPPKNLATGPGSGSNALKPAPDIQLPHGNGQPPVKTTGPIDLATLQKLQGMTFTGFQVQPHGLNPKKGMEVRQKTEDHPRLWATITVSPCTADGELGECTPIDLPKWKEKEAQLEASLMRPELIAAPDTVFELGTTELNGTPMIFQYQLAQTQPTPMPGTEPAGSAGSGSAAKPAKAGSAAKAGSGSAAKAGSGSAAKAGSGSAAVKLEPGSYSWSHAYTLYYNDGQNQIRVVAEYKDDPLITKEAMAEQVPRTDLENVAQAFMDVYTQAW